MNSGGYAENYPRLLRRGRITKIALVLFFLAVLGYAYYEARGLLFGPQITISTQLQEVGQPYVVIQGRADRISSLTVDGMSIPVTEGGAFQEPYLLAPGDNHITFNARDTYGRTSEKVIEIVYTPSATSTMAAPSASSTTEHSSPTSNGPATSSIATSTHP
jgi:hypothetical protein